MQRLQSLQLLMQREQQGCDQAQSALRRADDTARGARVQCEQLLTYRSEYTAEVRGGKDHVERPARGGVDQGLGRVAAQVHARGIVHGRHAGTAHLGHR